MLPQFFLQGGAPDVVYAFTPTADVAAEVSTCGSLYDTRLYIFDDPTNLQVWWGAGLGEVGVCYMSTGGATQASVAVWCFCEASGRRTKNSYCPPSAKRRRS